MIVNRIDRVNLLMITIRVEILLEAIVLGLTNVFNIIGLREKEGTTRQVLHFVAKKEVKWTELQ